MDPSLAAGHTTVYLVCLEGPLATVYTTVTMGCKPNIRDLEIAGERYGPDVKARYFYPIGTVADLAEALEDDRMAAKMQEMRSGLYGDIEAEYEPEGDGD